MWIAEGGACRRTAWCPRFRCWKPSHEAAAGGTVRAHAYGRPAKEHRAAVFADAARHRLAATHFRATHPVESDLPRILRRQPGRRSSADARNRAAVPQRVAARYHRDHSPRRSGRTGAGAHRAPGHPRIRYAPSCHWDREFRCTPPQPESPFSQPAPTISSRGIFRSRLDPQTEHTITDPERLNETIELVRTRGYSVNEQGLNTGITALGASIVNAQREPIGSVSISGPSSRITADKFARFGGAVRETAQRISAAL